MQSNNLCSQQCFCLKIQTNIFLDNKSRFFFLHNRTNFRGDPTDVSAEKVAMAVRLTCSASSLGSSAAQCMACGSHCCSVKSSIIVELVPESRTRMRLSCSPDIAPCRWKITATERPSQDRRMIEGGPSFSGTSKSDSSDGLFVSICTH